MYNHFYRWTICLICLTAPGSTTFSQDIISEMLKVSDSTTQNDSIVYHPVRVDQDGNILPWFSNNFGQSYNDALERVWLFWKNIQTDSNGEKYYLNHQVWSPQHDKRGLGGDQLMMAMSSWDLYYNYTGDTSLIGNMRYMADYYLEHGMSPKNAAWPNLPFPYNMKVEGKIYDGDMILGKDYLQPDKAGSFGFELVHLFKKTGQRKYLEAAISIANTLAGKVSPGDNDHSPWPFKVNALTGDTGILVNQEVWYEGMSEDLKKRSTGIKKSTYTTFWTSTLGLFSELIKMKEGNTATYKKAFQITFDWMMRYPANTNKWGPFFEDIPRWSDTQINAATFAMYLLEHPELTKKWKATAQNIIRWIYTELGNKEYLRYGVTCVNEQTAYKVPGNSHCARQASVDLLFSEKTGDTSFTRNAIRELNWATYMVDLDGKNFYPTNAIWMTDGYGDYTRHYLRAMAAAPILAPDNADHLLRSSSIITDIKYGSEQITYHTYDSDSHELLRLQSKPASVTVDGKKIEEQKSTVQEGWVWKAMDKGGVLMIKHQHGNHISISR